MGAGHCQAFPFVPVASLAVLVVGIPLWVIHSFVAVSSTSDALSAAAVGTAEVQTTMDIISMIRTVVLALSIVAAVLVVLLACAHAATRRSSRSRFSGGRPSVLRTLVAGDGFTSLLLWVVLAGAVAMFALTATLFLGSWAADGVLTMATSFSTDAEAAANRAVGSAQGLTDQLRITQLAALDVAPQEVKDTQWWKDFRWGVSNFNQTVAKAAGTPTSANCQPGCISLDFLAGLAGLDSTCICLTKTITDVQHGLRATKEASMTSLIGLGLVYVATSWLLLWAATSYTNTKRDLGEHRRLAKSSSTGEGLFSAGGLPSTADATMVVRGDDSPMAYKGASIAVPRGAHHDAPFIVANVAADTRVERDVGPRLPYV